MILDGCQFSYQVLIPEEKVLKRGFIEDNCGLSLPSGRLAVALRTDDAVAGGGVENEVDGLTGVRRTVFEMHSI